MSLGEHLRFLADLVRAIAHRVRLGYYMYCIEHVGPTHPDADLLVRCALESQMAVDDFWTRWSER